MRAAAGRHVRGSLRAHRVAACVGRRRSRARKVVGALREKVDSLKTAFPDAEVELDANRERVTRIRGLKAESASASAEELALSVLKKPAVAATLGLSTDLRELCPPVSRKDPQIPDYAVVRMQQCVNGIKVLGAELVMSVRVKPAPAIDALTSSLRTELPVPPRRRSAPTTPSRRPMPRQKNGNRKKACVRHRPRPGRRARRLPSSCFSFPRCFSFKGRAGCAGSCERIGLPYSSMRPTVTVVHQLSETMRGVS